MDYFKEATYQESQLLQSMSGAKMCDLDMRDFTELSFILIEQKNDDIDYTRTKNKGYYIDSGFRINFWGMEYFKDDPIVYISQSQAFDLVPDPPINAYITIGSPINSNPYLMYQGSQGYILPTTEQLQSLPVYQSYFITGSQSFFTTSDIDYYTTPLVIPKNKSIVKYNLFIHKNTENYFFIQLTVNPQVKYTRFDKYFICDQIDGLVEFIKDLFNNTHPQQS